jgi:integrase
MLVLTGQRREEAAGMTWAELSGDFSTWVIPASRAKNGATHIVPLSEPAQDLLCNATRFGASEIGLELAFPGLRGTFNGFSKAKATLDARSGVTDWRLHDLRRTMATGLQRLGVRLEVTVYQRHDFASEKRAALDAWGAHVQAIVAGRANAGNVVTLRERA